MGINGEFLRIHIRNWCSVPLRADPEQALTRKHIRFYWHTQSFGFHYWEFKWDFETSEFRTFIIWDVEMQYLLAVWSNFNLICYLKSCTLIYCKCLLIFWKDFSPSTSELNSSAPRCLMRFYTGDFASLTVHFVNICVKNQQIHQLLIQFINYVWLLLHVSALHCHLHGAFLVPSERYSIEEQSIKYCGWACCV
jgi:hypothetical protein